MGDKVEWGHVSKMGEGSRVGVGVGEIVSIILGKEEGHKHLAIGYMADQDLVKIGVKVLRGRGGNGEGIIKAMLGKEKEHSYGGRCVPM